jgi:hypothetical protein
LILPMAYETQGHRLKLFKHQHDEVDYGKSKQTGGKT